MTGKTTKSSRRKYDTSFKEQVLKMASSVRIAIEISQAFRICENLIYRWKKETHMTTNDSGDSFAQDAGQSALFVENERLKKDLVRTEQDRDILKKALEIFSSII